MTVIGKVCDAASPALPYVPSLSASSTVGSSP